MLQLDEPSRECNYYKFKSWVRNKTAIELILHLKLSPCSYYLIICCSKLLDFPGFLLEKKLGEQLAPVQTVQLFLDFFFGGGV